jgi:hypothetical protein
MFAGHIKVLGGPHVARGPDVAQAWSKVKISVLLLFFLYLLQRMK